jgi:hypothetical protein
LNKKSFLNHQDTFSNVIFDQTAPKNLIKIDKQAKRFSNFKAAKFPSDNTFEALQIAIKSKIAQNSHYHSRITVPKPA